MGWPQPDLKVKTASQDDSKDDLSTLFFPLSNYLDKSIFHIKLISLKTDFARETSFIHNYFLLIKSLSRVFNILPKAKKRINRRNCLVENHCLYLRSDEIVLDQPLD